MAQDIPVSLNRPPGTGERYATVEESRDNPTCKKRQSRGDDG
jgi:hypothetical protein